MSKKMLLLEDSLHDVALTLRALRHCSVPAKLIHVDDGAMGLQHLASNADIALVLLDLNLRIIDGFELLKVMRSNPNFVDTPVVVVSTSNIASDRERAETLGENGFVVKDADPVKYFETICIALAPFQHLLDSLDARSS